MRKNYCGLGMLFLVGALCLGGAAAPALAQSAYGGSANNYQKTVWVGSETLGGYGRLEFQFYDNGTAVMIDAREVSNGSYQRNGSSITLTFPGRAVYQGTISGNTMSGSARDDTRTWSWTVQFQQGQ